MNENGFCSSPIPIVRDRSFYPGTFLVIASNIVGLYKSAHNSCHLYRTMHPTDVIYIEPCIQQIKIMDKYA